jgi:guanylate kinase
MTGSLIIFSAPSGAGKSTIIKALLNQFPGKFVYSISATTRLPRNKEVNGRDYFFLSVEDFKQKIRDHEFVEWEIVHTDYYGTLKATVDNFLAAGKQIVFDLDVKGALQVKEKYPKNTLLIFIAPKSAEVLIERLKKRGTETAVQINMRLERYAIEMDKSQNYDHIVINDILEDAVSETVKIIEKFSRNHGN